MYVSSPGPGMAIIIVPTAGTTADLLQDSGKDLVLFLEGEAKVATAEINAAPL